MTGKSGILKWEELGPVGVVKIAPGNSSNSIPKPDFADPFIIRNWIEREEIQGVIVMGEGRHFSAGALLDYFHENQLSHDDILSKFEIAEDILSYLENLEKPVIAAVDGVCFGAGFEITLACHLRICSKNALFGFPEITHGIIPGFGGIQRLGRIAGRSRTLSILFTGDTISAENALNWGIVNQVIQEKSSFDAALKLITKIIGMGSKPVAYTIRSLNNAGKMGYERAIKEECKMFAELVIEQYKPGMNHD